MHFSQGSVPLNLCHHLYGALFILGTFGGLVLFCLVVMVIYDIPGIELVLGLSCLSFYGLLQTLVLPMSTLIEIEHIYHSFSVEIKCHPPEPSDLAIDKRILRESNKEDAALASVCNKSLCSICLQGFEIGQEISIATPCGHKFHSRCLRMWIPKSSTCPYCRQDLEKPCPKPREEEVDTEDTRSRDGRGFFGAFRMFEGVSDAIYEYTS